MFTPQPWRLWMKNACRRSSRLLSYMLLSAKTLERDSYAAPSETGLGIPSVALSLLHLHKIIYMTR